MEAIGLRDPAILSNLSLSVSLIILVIMVGKSENVPETELYDSNPYSEAIQTLLERSTFISLTARFTALFSWGELNELTALFLSIICISPPL